LKASLSPFPSSEFARSFLVISRGKKDGTLLPVTCHTFLLSTGWCPF
jgi:hypothetical protein